MKQMKFNVKHLCKRKYKIYTLHVHKNIKIHMPVILVSVWCQSREKNDYWNFTWDLQFATGIHRNLNLWHVLVHFLKMSSKQKIVVWKLKSLCWQIWSVHCFPRLEGCRNKNVVKASIYLALKISTQHR